MDPNETLTKIREQRKILATHDQSSLPFIGAALKLSELVGALDEWLTKGGFLPNDWERRSDVLGLKYPSPIVQEYRSLRQEKTNNEKAGN